MGLFDSRWLEQRDLGKLSAKPDLGPSFKALTLVAQKPNPLLSRGRISFLFVCNLLLFVKKTTNPNQIWLMNLISLLLMLVHLPLILCNVRLSVNQDLSWSRVVHAKSWKCPPPRPASTATPRSTWSLWTSSPTKSTRISVPLPITWTCPTSAARIISLLTSMMVTSLSWMIPVQLAMI